MHAKPVLETARLLLRQFEERDLDAYAAMCADPEVMRYIGDGQTANRAIAWRSMAFFRGHWALRGYGMYVAEEKASGTFLGRIGLLDPEGWPGLEVGWVLAREHWGKGFASEGAAAVRDHVFGDLRVPRLISLIRPENAASARVAARIGETFDRVIEMGGKTVNVFAIDNPASA